MVIVLKPRGTFCFGLMSADEQISTFARLAMCSHNLGLLLAHVPANCQWLARLTGCHSRMMSGRKET